MTTPSKITPLWIVAAFVTLTEAVLGYAVTQVAGGVQIALTVFVISFALMVAGAFFAILWNRPWVFYSPSEYADVDPKQFMSALREAPSVANQVKLVQTVENNPSDIDARFSLIDSMADEVHGQFIIFSHENNIDLLRYQRYAYAHDSGGAGSGFLSGFGKDKFEGTGLVKVTGGGRYLQLTSEGHKFAEWLITKQRKCSAFWCEQGSWGNIEDGIIKDWIENLKKQG